MAKKPWNYRARPRISPIIDVPTMPTGTRTTQVASTEFVQQELGGAGVVGTAYSDIVWLSNFAGGHTLTGLNNVIAAHNTAGNPVWDFRITKPLSITLASNLSLHKNLRVKLEASAKITLAGGHDLTINGWQEHDPTRQYFFAATTNDRILLSLGATAIEHLEYWAGSGNGSNDDHAFTQWFASGGRVKQASNPGPYYCTKQSTPANTWIFGSKFTKLRNTNPTGTDPIWKVVAGISDVEIAGWWFDCQNTTTHRGLELQVTAGGASKFNIDIHHNHFSGAGVSAPTMLDLISTGSNAEFVQIWIKQNGFQTDGAGAYGIGTDSTNIKVHVAHNAWYAGIGSNFCKFTNSGWLDLDENDLRGPAGANYDTGVTEVSQRTQANVSVASGGRALTLLAGTSPAFTKDDEGQKVVMSGKFDSYIEEFIDSYHATLSSNVSASSGAATNANMTVYRQTDPTGLANIAYHFLGDRGITTVKSVIDEGVCHFIKVEASIGKANSPINLVGGQIQGRLTSDSTQEFNFFGTEMFSTALRQGGGVSPVLNGIITPLCTTLYRGVGSFNGFRQLAKGNPIGNYSDLWSMPNLTINRETNAFSIAPLVQLKDAVLKGTVSGGDQLTDFLRLKGTTNSDPSASGLTLNESGGKIGFGTATPTEAFHFYNASGFKAKFDAPLASDVQIRIASAGVDLWAAYRPASSSDFRIYNFTKGDDNLKIDPTTGRIGILNNFPTSLLSLGYPGFNAGSIDLAGATSGVNQIVVPAVAGNPVLTLPTVTGTFQQQFTTAITSSSAPTVTGDRAYNILDITALATGATFAAPSGTPLDGNCIRVRWKDNGSSQTLAYNAIFRAVGVTLPTATTISKTGYFDAVYNGTDSKWDVITVVTEGVLPTGPTILKAFLTADLLKTNTTFSNVTDLTITLLAGHTYQIKLVGYCEATGVGLNKFDLNGGTATVTGMSGLWMITNDSTSNVNGGAFYTLSNVATGGPAVDFGGITIECTIKCNAAGTLIPRYAQATLDAGNPSVLKAYTSITAIDIT